MKSIRIDQDKLILDGHRVGLELKDNQQSRITLRESIHIEIAKSPNGNYGPALDVVFADGLTNLVPWLPSYWQPYAQKHLLPTPTMPNPTPPQSPPQHAAARIDPPKLLSSAEPIFSDLARSYKYGGAVVVNLWVEPDGKATHVTISRAIGTGMDDDALAPVRSYVFFTRKG